MHKNPPKITGSCLCQDIRFEADGVEDNASACHCHMCQKAHGGPIGAYVTLTGHRWLSGEELIHTWQSSETCQRTFCSQCGSTLEFKSANSPNRVEMAISTLDGDHGVTLTKHIFVESKANWYEIPDELPRFDKGD